MKQPGISCNKSEQAELIPENQERPGTTEKQLQTCGTKQNLLFCGRTMKLIATQWHLIVCSLFLFKIKRSFDNRHKNGIGAYFSQFLRPVSVRNALYSKITFCIWGCRPKMSWNWKKQGLIFLNVPFCKTT